MKRKLSMLMALLCITMMSWAGTVTIPTTVGGYISTAEATLTNCNSENSGKNIGSTRNGSTMTVNLNNTTAGDYFLQFLSGASGLTATIDVNVKGSGYDETQSFNIANTGSWDLSEFHAMELKALPAGELTLKLTVTSTTGSYAGNYGMFAIHGAEDYLDLSTGTYSGARTIDNASSQGGKKVGYCSNNTSASYIFYAPEDGNYNLCMAMNRSSDGTMNVSISDYATGAEEVNQDIAINSDLCKGYGVEVPMALSSALTAGFKTIKLTFNTSGSFLMDYENVRVTKVKQTITMINANLNGGTNAPTVTGEYAGSAVAKTQASATNGGYKFDSGCYVGLTLANGYTFKAGDVLHVNVASKCTGGSKLALYSDLGETLLAVTGIGQETGDLTFTLTDAFNGLSTFYLYRSATYGWNGYVASVSVTGVERELVQSSYNVNYSLGESGATGKVPANIAGVNTSTKYTVPANSTIYKEGYTLKGWTDGENEYLIGQSYDMQEKTYSITPIFTQNKVALSELNKDLTVTWKFGKSNGAPDFDGSAQNYVKQVSLNGNTTDLAVKMAGGSNSGRGDEWMNNQQKNMTVPVCAGAVVTAKVYYNNQTCVINGESMPYDEAVNGAQGNIVYTYTCPEGVGSTIDVNVGNQFLSYIEVTYPGSSTPWANFEDFALDFSNGAYITSTETNPITIGFKKSGQNFVRCAADDADAIGTVTGKFHSNEHGLQNFKLTVAVPGNVKISAGTCAWGGNLTVKKGGVTVATVNTNNGTCYHQNAAKNKVITYYEGEATTLTIEGGNYMPFISVESVENVPSLYTLTFKNGETTVATKDIYEGTGVGTTPTIDGLASDQYFLGWYSDASQIDTRVNAATIPEGNTTYYAVVKTINTNAAGQLAPEAGDAFSFLAHLETANKIATAAAPAQIYLVNGTYDLGSIVNTEVKTDVQIFGESRDGVLIVNHPNVGGMSNSETLNVRGSNVYMQNFSVRCDVSYPESKVSHVGTAIRTYGDKNIFYNMNMQGNQDTFNTPMGDNAAAYVKGGRIEGTVDYICGSGNVWFEGVNLYMNDRTNADVIAAPSTKTSEYGYVFNNCTIDGVAGQAGRYNLARGWQNSPAATWVNTICKIAPSDKGYVFMHDPLTVRFHEFGTVNNSGAAIEGHSIAGLGYAANSDAIYLKASAAKDYSYANVLGGWDPEAIIAQYNSASATVNSNVKYGTFYSNSEVTIPEETKAYTAELNDNKLTLTELEGDVIPAKTAVVLSGEGGEFVNSNTGAKFEGKNDLQGTAVAMPTAFVTEGTVCVLGFNNSKAGFYKFSGKTLGAGKAYLVVPAAQAAKGIIISFDTPTAISNVNMADSMNAAEYNLAGQCVNGSAKGIVIKNGKKYIK